MSNDPRKRHPWIALVVGRRGSGKTWHAGKIASEWRARARRADQRSMVLAIDPVATDPPQHGQLAASADLWSPEMPDEVPDPVQLLVVDEADLYAPQADARRRPPPPLVDLVRRGRHRGVSLLLCTQRPALVMRDVFALADFVVICQTTDQRDLDALCTLHGVKEHRERIATTIRPGPVVTWRPDGVEVHK
jgi:hypothetical protein